jgi:hypothetical protein
VSFCCKWDSCVFPKQQYRDQCDYDLLAYFGIVFGSNTLSDTPVTSLAMALTREGGSPLEKFLGLERLQKGDFWVTKLQYVAQFSCLGSDHISISRTLSF